MNIRNSIAKSVNGVAGVFSDVVASNEFALFSSQKWVSETRRLSDDSGNFRVTLRFDDSCKNGHMTFAMTGEGRDMGGMMHSEIKLSFPELACFEKWHCVSTDAPMHYVANTVYHAKSKKFDYARSCAVWPEISDAELSGMSADELKAALLARLPALMQEFKVCMENIGFIYKVI